MSARIKTVAIIVAAGRGKRMGKPKQFLDIAGVPLVEWTLSVFQKSSIVDGIILVVGKGNIRRAKKLRYSKLLAVVEGGAERQDSVAKGLSALPLSARMVLVHDGARPGVTSNLIINSVKAAGRYGAAVVGVPVKDTIKEVKSLPAGRQGQNSKVKSIGKTIDRKVLWQAQTPQAFRKAIILKAYASIKGAFTDDAGLVEKMGYPIKMVMGSYDNFKVTTPEDLKLMEAILKDRKV